jgi:hypothetical protein
MDLFLRYFQQNLGGLFPREAGKYKELVDFGRGLPKTWCQGLEIGYFFDDVNGEGVSAREISPSSKSWRSCSSLALYFILSW